MFAMVWAVKHKLVYVSGSSTQEKILVWAVEYGGVYLVFFINIVFEQKFELLKNLYNNTQLN